MLLESAKVLIMLLGLLHKYSGLLKQILAAGCSGADNTREPADPHLLLQCGQMDACSAQAGGLRISSRPVSAAGRRPSQDLRWTCSDRSFGGPSSSTITGLSLYRIMPEAHHRCGQSWPVHHWVQIAALPI